MKSPSSKPTATSVTDTASDCYQDEEFDEYQNDDFDEYEGEDEQVAEPLQLPKKKGAQSAGTTAPMMSQKVFVAFWFVRSFLSFARSYRISMNLIEYISRTM